MGQSAQAIYGAETVDRWRSTLVIALVLLLAVLAALFLVWPVWRAFLPLESFAGRL